MKYKFDVREITKEQCLAMVQKYHYSNTLPRLNKHYLGFFLNGEMVGTISLGWGTRPRHTIQCLFPSLDTKDYLEIGRMCMTEEMPRNSESQMLSACIKWIKRNLPEQKILFTWADGMLGKCGYVYQASNFIYCGWVGGGVLSTKRSEGSCQKYEADTMQGLQERQTANSKTNTRPDARV